MKPDVRSESVGEGPIRQVVIVPSEMKTLPEPVIPPRPRPEMDSPAAGRDSAIAAAVDATAIAVVVLHAAARVVRAAISGK